MIYVGVLAAGIGERMHRQDLPKQFLNLGSKPIIIHTLEQFYINPQTNKIIIVAPDDWRQYAEDLVEQFGTMSLEVMVIGGGVNKVVSVHMIVNYIEKAFGIKDGDILLTHDAVRPFVTQRVIDENIRVAEIFGAASTVMTTNDTIVVSEDEKTLSSVPSKARMFAEQTPQTFNLRLLAQVFEKAAKQGIALENESELARLYIAQGGQMQLVRGEYFNIKIINPYDLEVAEALLRERSETT